MAAARATRAACRSRERGGGGKAACTGARPPELLRRQGEGRWMQEDMGGSQQDELAEETGRGEGRGGGDAQ